jgi:hypothetical protein
MQECCERLSQSLVQAQSVIQQQIHKQGLPAKQDEGAVLEETKEQHEENAEFLPVLKNLRIPPVHAKHQIRIAQPGSRAILTLQQDEQEVGRDK